MQYASLDRLLIVKESREYCYCTCFQMLANLNKLLVAQLRENWTSANTSLSEACLSIIRCKRITDFISTNYTSVRVVKGIPNPNNAPKGTCDNENCVKMVLQPTGKINMGNDI